jgi:hypothetical protein
LHSSSFLAFTLETIWISREEGGFFHCCYSWVLSIRCIWVFYILLPGKLLRNSPFGLGELDSNTQCCRPAELSEIPYIALPHYHLHCRE